MKKLLLLVLAIGLGFAVSAKAQNNSPCEYTSNNRTFYNGGAILIPYEYTSYDYIVRSGNVSIREGDFGLSIFGSGKVDFQIIFYNVPGDCNTIIHNYTGEIKPRSSGGGTGGGGGGTIESPKFDNPGELTTVE